jgi:hypothetical protein
MLSVSETEGLDYISRINSSTRLDAGFSCARGAPCPAHWAANSLFPLAMAAACSALAAPVEEKPLATVDTALVWRRGCHAALRGLA